MKTIEATMFIVPNSAVTVKSQLDWERKLNQISGASTTKTKNIFGELSEDDKLVEIWVFEDENQNPNDEDQSGNWADHGRKIPEWDDKIKEEYRIAKASKDDASMNEIWNRMDDNEWPSYFPLSKISHLNDGDTLEVEWKGCRIKLKVDQLNTRYGSVTGDFQSALKRVVKTAY